MAAVRELFESKCKVDVLCIIILWAVEMILNSGPSDLLSCSDSHILSYTNNHIRSCIINHIISCSNNVS